MCFKHIIWVSFDINLNQNSFVFDIKFLAAIIYELTTEPGVTRPYSWYFNGRDIYPCILMGKQCYQSH